MVVVDCRHTTQRPPAWAINNLAYAYALGDIVLANRAGAGSEDIETARDLRRVERALHLCSLAHFPTLRAKPVYLPHDTTRHAYCPCTYSDPVYEIGFWRVNACRASGVICLLTGFRDQSLTRKNAGAKRNATSVTKRPVCGSRQTRSNTVRTSSAECTLRMETTLKDGNDPFE